MRQRTLSQSYTFEGKGLHTGRIARMTVHPAPADTGIRFRRVDQGEHAWIPACADRVSSTARSTRLSGPCGDVNTVEHILSALSLICSVDSSPDTYSTFPYLFAMFDAA